MTPTPDQPTGTVRRPLTSQELADIYAAIAAATNPGNLVVATITATYTPLLASLGRTIDTLGSEPINPNDFAVPSSQWQAVVAVATNRAHEWGAAVDVSLYLVNTMPSSYDDPSIPDPTPEMPDRRPDMHHLHVSRMAIDVIEACADHVTALGLHFGIDSDIYRRAATTWQYHLAQLFSMRFGGETTITADGRMSLLVTAATGHVYGLIFHGTPRTCLGCGTVITDNGDPEHIHQPSYPIDAPQPGEWSAHS